MTDTAPAPAPAQTRGRSPLAAEWNAASRWPEMDLQRVGRKCWAGDGGSKHSAIRRWSPASSTSVDAFALNDVGSEACRRAALAVGPALEQVEQLRAALDKMRAERDEYKRAADALARALNLLTVENDLLRRQASQHRHLSKPTPLRIASHVTDLD